MSETPEIVPLATLLQTFQSTRKTQKDAGAAQITGWREFYDQWLKIRPHSTGLVDFPLWGIVSEALATVEHSGKHTEPPRGLIWE